jgi:PAS domain S-box-containing protein
MDGDWLQNLYRLALQYMQDGIILTDADGDVVFVNDAAENIRKIQREDILGKSVVDCHRSSSRDKVLRAIAYLKTHENAVINRMVIDAANDKVYENVYETIFDSGHVLQGLAVVSRDVTEKRKAEESKAAYMKAQELAYDALRTQMLGLVMTSMEVLTNLLETRDRYTNGHSKSVSVIASTLYEHRYGVDKQYIDMQWAAKLHDIGKVCIPDAIVQKAGKLTREEYEIIKQHSSIAGDIIRPLDPGGHIWPAIRHHHERYDGKGYPDGLSGTDIPDGARLITIADSYNAMRTCRPYRETMSFEQSLEEIRRNTGTQFDPGWVEVFLDLASTGSID